MPSSSTDYNLLLALLAFQNNFIDRQALLTVFDRWTGDKSRSIGELLVEQRRLTPAQRQLVEALTAEHLKQHQNDPQRSLAALSSWTTGHSALAQLADADLQESLQHVGGAAGAGTLPLERGTARAMGGASTIQLTSPPQSTPGARFRILRPHAKGGLGQVSVALDEELHREVALKEIQERHADDPRSRARFVQEAEITGGLEHPGIVPVYGLGQYADGRPYYAMRFIRGSSLKEALDDFHEAGGRPRDRGLQLRKLLGRFIDVCNAISYAHSRGVLHRDLKPGNIMLGKYGETLVVDWGLAKSQADGSESDPDVTEGPLQVSSGNMSVTQAGVAVGTVAYMSPEQAAGNIAALGPATDVYSLGATLYHLLVGRAPFDRGSGELDDTLRRVQEGDFPRPRALSGVVPPALEAICLKAMSRRPQDRYESPDDLAADVERWLADEPVKAFAEPVTVTLARVGRRHRGMLVAATAGLVLLTVVSVAAALLVNTQRQRAEQLAGEKSALAVRMTESAAEEKRQRLAADQEKQRAVAAEGRLSRAVEKTEQSLYLAQINLAANAWLAGDIVSLRRNLDRAAPRGANQFEWRYLDRLAREELVVYGAHQTDVHALALAPNGELAASGDNAGHLHVWNVETGELVFQRQAHTWVINALAFSPDSRRLALAGHLGKLAVWDVENRTELREFTGHNTQVFDVAFHPDGQSIASAGADMTIRTWNVDTGKPVHVLQGHESFAFSVAYAPDGKRLVSGSQDSTVRIWNNETGQEERQLSADRGFTNEVAFSPDGKYVAAVHELPWGQQETHASIAIWEAGSGKEHLVRQPQRGSAHAIAFSPDGRTLATGADDGSVHLMDVASGATVLVHRGHLQRVWDVQFSADGKLLASCGSDGTARLRGAFVDPRSTPLEPVSRSPDLAIAFVPPGTHIAYGERSGVAVRSVETGDSLGHFEAKAGVMSGSACVAVDPTGTKVAGLTESQHVIAVWEIATRKELYRLTDHGAVITDVAFAADGQTLVTGCTDRKVRVWDAAQGKPLLTLSGAKYPITAIAVDRQGQQIVAGAAEPARRRANQDRPRQGELLLWRLPNEAPERLGTAQAPVSDVHFMAGDGQLAVGLATGPIQIWELASREIRTTFTGHAGGTSSLSCFPDGQRIVSCGADSRLRVWDLLTGEQFLELDGHTRAANSVAVAPDGLRIVSARGDMLNPGEILLWETEATPAARQRRVQRAYSPAFYRRQLQACVTAKHEFGARWYARALDAAEPSSENALKIAKALMSLAASGDAQEWCDRALQRDPKLADAWKFRGAMLEMTKDIPGAIAAYQRYAELRPAEAMHHYHVGNLQREEGDLAGAAASFGAAARADREFAEAFCNQGQVLVRLGRFPEAIEALAKGHEVGLSRNQPKSGVRIVRPPWKYPSDRWLAEAQALQKIDEALPQFLTGEKQPANVGECYLVIRACYIRGKDAESQKFATRLTELEAPLSPPAVSARIYLARAQLRQAATAEDAQQKVLREETLEALQGLAKRTHETGQEALQRTFFGELAQATEYRALLKDEKLTPGERQVWTRLAESDP